tara:strand:+ start:113 stop:574 length:462 start_codon:yes stop_codon:yes gene_type:complete
MKDELMIREAGATDVPNLVRFNLEMARETEEKELDSEVLTRGVEGIFEKPERGFYLVGEMNGEMVGSLMVTKEWSDWRNGDFWWIQSVFVESEFRRRGIFRGLYEEARKRAMEADGVCGCRLYVEKENEVAQAVYVRRGFHETPYRLFEDGFE